METDKPTVAVELAATNAAAVTVTITAVGPPEMSADLAKAALTAFHALGFVAVAPSEEPPVLGHSAAS